MSNGIGKPALDGLRRLADSPQRTVPGVGLAVPSAAGAVPGAAGALSGARAAWLLARVTLLLAWGTLMVACGHGGDPEPQAAAVRQSGACPAPEPRRQGSQPAPDPEAGRDIWMVTLARGNDSESVRRLLDHPIPDVRARAALAAGRLGAPALRRPTLERFVDPSATVRQAVAVAAAVAGWAAAEEPLLVRAAVDAAAPVRRTAIRALGAVGGTPAAQALVKLVGDDSLSPDLRAVVFDALSRLARRGASSVQPALGPAVTWVRSRTASLPVRRAAARFVSTLLDRQSAARPAVSGRARAALSAAALAERDPELRAALVRAAVALGLLGSKALAAIVPAAGGAGRLAAEALVEGDRRRGVHLVPLLERLVSQLPSHACRDGQPEMLWLLLRRLGRAPDAAWLRRAAPEWHRALEALRGRAAPGSCAAQQMSRLACEAAVLADRASRRVHSVRDCGGPEIGSTARAVLRVRALGRARGGRGVWRRLMALYRAGPIPVQVAVLAVAGVRNDLAARRLVSRALGSPRDAVFAAAAEACARQRSRPVPAGAPSCTARARRLLVGLARPPRGQDVERWIELVKLVDGYGDPGVLRALRAAVRSYHPTLRQVAQHALARVMGRAPRPSRWDGDRRSPPASPPLGSVRLVLQVPPGRIVIQLHPDWAPLSVGHLVDLVRRGALGQSAVHRVVPGFVVQGGDPTGTGFGGSTGLRLSEWGPVTFRRGVVGMAHAGKDTEGSQFFIVTGDAPHLDFAYTAVGEVVSGLEVADRVLPGAPLQIWLQGAPPRRRRTGRSRSEAPRSWTGARRRAASAGDRRRSARANSRPVGQPRPHRAAPPRRRAPRRRAPGGQP